MLEQQAGSETCPHRLCSERVLDFWPFLPCTLPVRQCCLGCIWRVQQE